MLKLLCDYCGKEIKRFPRSIERNKHNFCSQKCKIEFQKGKKPWNKGRKSGGVIKCIVCGKKFYVYPIYTKRNARFCSQKCVRQFLRGEKHPSWQGGVSKLPYSFEFNKCLKENIKKRDNWTCQKCDKKNDLVIHHIDYNKMNCKPNNLITLCRSCNGMVNRETKYWIKYFRSKIKT